VAEERARSDAELTAAALDEAHGALVDLRTKIVEEQQEVMSSNVP
jgi:hypothetical protein